jgi:hypothetical protein
MFAVAINGTGFPASPTYFAATFPHQVFIAPTFRMLMSSTGTLTFPFYQFPCILDYLFRKGHNRTST